MYVRPKAESTITSVQIDIELSGLAAVTVGNLSAQLCCDTSCKKNYHA